MDYSSWLETATDIAERAANLAHSYFRQALLIETKENQTPVTIADKKAEELIRSELSKAFPDHGIMGEEFGLEGADKEFVWTVDPIDGTRSFIRGIPLYGTLLGLLKRGEPVMGIMVMPALDETYTAAEGLGTYCNGVQVHVSPTRTLDTSNISVGDTSAFLGAGKENVLRALGQKTELLRSYTDCFGHALVIRGSLDAMVDPIVSPWDVVPLACLVKEAGGTYFDFQGANTFDRSFISCTPALKDQILSLL